MVWFPPVMALVLALLFGFILIWLLGWRHPRGRSMGASVIFILLFLFPLLWAVSLWTGPAGPVWMGVSIIPVLAIGLLVVLLVAAAATPGPKTPVEAQTETPEGERAAAAFGIVFWLLMLIAAGFVVAGYFAT